MISLVVAAAALTAGLLIGLTGIGGVLLVPALTEIAAVPVERAVAASMTAFLLGGSIAAALHLRRATPAASALLPLCGAAALGAAIGAVTLQWLDPGAVRLFIALIALLSGAQALLAPSTRDGVRPPAPRLLGPIGLAVGYGSAVSGTGGPVLLIPILLALRTQTHTAVGLALAAQVPITLSATVVNALAGRIDLALAAPLAVLVLAGTTAGSLLSARLSGRVLTRLIAALLIAVGVWYGCGAVAAR